MSKGGYHAWVTMLDNGFIVEATGEDAEVGVYNLFSTLRSDDESIEQEEMGDSDMSEEPGDSQATLVRQEACVTMEMLGKRKRG